MPNVVQASISDQAIWKLMETVNKLRSGEVVGVTLVTTSDTGVVEMATLCVPMPSDRHESLQCEPRSLKVQGQQTPG
jgi:hypothetical protein